MNTDWLAAALAADASEGDGALPGWLRPLRPGMHLVGQASTASVTADDNADLRRAVERGPQPGAILVVSGAGDATHACMGGLLAKELRLRGFSGVITDGLVRDAGEIVASGLQVWCRGHSPVAPFKRGGGHIGIAITLGATTIRPGDYVIADEDGIVVWPQERYAELLALAKDRLHRDQQRERELDAQFVPLRPPDASDL